jgi:hypothetical protein
MTGFFQYGFSPLRCSLRHRLELFLRLLASRHFGREYQSLWQYLKLLTLPARDFDGEPGGLAVYSFFAALSLGRGI